MIVYHYRDLGKGGSMDVVFLWSKLLVDKPRGYIYIYIYTSLL